MLTRNTEDIIAGLKLQNPAACAKLFSNYSTFAEKYYLKRYGSSFGNIHLDDALQECLKAAVNHAHKFGGSYPQQLDSFAKRMFSRVIDCYMRRFVAHSRRTAGTGFEEDAFPLEAIPDRSCEDTEDNIVLKIAFDRVVEKHIAPALTRSELELFNSLHRDEDLNRYCSSCGISRDAVRKRKSRLLRKVRTLFDEPEARLTYGS